MKGFHQLIVLGKQGVQGASQLGAAIVQRALDRVYGQPQLAGVVAMRRHVRRIAAKAVPAPDVAASTAGAVDERVDSGPDRAVPMPVLAVAERVRTAKLVGPHNIVYGLMWLYLYPAQGIARRVLKVTDKHLAKALKRKYYYFQDVPFDPVAGCTPLFDGMYAECRKILNGRARQARCRPLSKHKADSNRPPANANADVVRAMAQAPAAHSPGPSPASHGAAAAPAGFAVQGEVFEGVVISAGRTSRTGPDDVGYTTFCLTLNDGSREIPLYGTELQRQSAALGIVAGERVRVLFMGKVATQVPGRDGPAFRNLYQLARVGQP